MCLFDVAVWNSLPPAQKFPDRVVAYLQSRWHDLGFRLVRRADALAGHVKSNGFHKLGSGLLGTLGTGSGRRWPGQLRPYRSR